MDSYRVALFVLIVAAGTVVSAVPASATSTSVDDHPGVDVDAVDVSQERVDATGEPTDVGTDQSAENDSANNTSLGADISSFMQSNAAEVGGEVESGMWSAAFDESENRSERERLVDRRTSELRTRVTDLEDRKEELNAEREADNVSEVAYKAEASRLIGQINALQSAINATTERAREVNTNVETLTTLQTEAKNLTGPEISSVARNVTGVGVDDEQRGRPTDTGNENGVEDVDDVTNETTGPPADVGRENDTVNASQRDQSNDLGDSPLIGNGSENGTTASVPDVNTSGAPSVATAEADTLGADGVVSVPSTTPVVTSDFAEGLADSPSFGPHAVTSALSAL